MQRPTILFLNRVYPPSRGATGRVLHDLARSFAREGWQVTVITTGPKAGTERDGAVRVIRVRGPEQPRGILGYMSVWLKLFWAAARLPGPHLLVTMTDPPVLVLAGHILSSLKKSKHIHWCHDLYPQLLPALNVWLPGFVNSILAFLSRWAMNGADKVIVIGRCMARSLALDGLDPTHMTVIPNWYEPVLSQPVEAVAPQGPPRFRILYAGNMGRAHPVDTIIAAARSLQDTHPDIEFMFLGDGARFDDIVEARARYNLENIRLLPYQPAERLRPILEGADLHLISMDERAAGYLVPCKFYASLVVERPSIFLGPAACEIAKIIHDYGCGSVLSPADVESFVEKIVDYRYNSDAWFAAQKGAKEAGQIFTPQASIEAWIERAWALVGPDVQKDIT